ncbi:uncharacterized protein LOC128953613 [Oppia nitens]|uniref:uncharacterized protein LOC128953613 n=1 Tax=Oppia nitens TaxID=1686743 RepID=UPI0023DAAA62|nr:uncharacterized protein LOC128953613 [Oppia nitens]
MKVLTINMSKLLLPLLLISICCVITYGAPANSTKSQCSTGNDADKCMMHLLLIGDPKYKFPENMVTMNTHCRQIKNYENCIKDYSKKCLQSFPRQVTGVLAYGVAKTNKGYCTNKKRKDSFIEIGKCANNIKHLGDACMKTYIDDLQGIENFKDAKLKLPIACCNFYKMKQCILISVEKNGKPVCSDSNYQEIERIIDGYSYDVLQLICGEYTEDSDKCQSLLPKTPKKRSSQKSTRSLLPPFINILSTSTVENI